MKVFISWSGEKSKVAALALRDWLPKVIQRVEPWISSSDIEAGKRWNQELSNQLQETKFGIICVTKDNFDAPWLNFEAGAIAKTVGKDSYACPYLIGIDPSDLPSGPLTQFQAKRSNKNDTYDLVSCMNKCISDGRLSEELLKSIFEKWWPDLDEQLQQLPSTESLDTEERPSSDMIKEILEIVRDLSFRSSSVTPTIIDSGKPWFVQFRDDPVTLVPSSSFITMSENKPAIAVETTSCKNNPGGTKTKHNAFYVEKKG